MSELRSAYRYATAILGVAEELNQLDRISADFAVVAKAIHDSREFHLFLKSPIVNKEKKKKLLDEVFRSIVNETTMKFIRLVTDKGRETILAEIIEQFNALRDKRLGIVNVTVRTVSPMTLEQQKQLAGRLQKATSKSVRLTEELDPKLIGGFTVQYEGTVWDGSVRHQMEKLRERLVAGPI